MTIELSPPLRAPATASRMTEAARRFLDALSADQRGTAHFPFAGEERYFWHYTPVDRNGLKLADMTDAQQQLAYALLASGLSLRGAQQARAIIDLEPILKETERIEGLKTEWLRDSSRYTFSVFGEPGGSDPWGWRAGGHHIGISFTIVGGDWVAAEPFFFGANPAEVRHGPQTGLRVLAEEEDLARTLLAALDREQRAIAIVDPVAPDDILTKNYRSADPAVAPQGILYRHLTGEQQGLLAGLIRHYASRTADDVAANTWERVVSGGLESVGFAWAGGDRRGEGHYYAIKGATFLIEYDNTQNNANHIHSVWRDFSNDWGEDLLVAHYKGTHHQGDHDHHH